jgi:hypothetical protein
VRLNDTYGIFGSAVPIGDPVVPWIDERFELDPNNAPVHAKTGYPVCVPRVAPPANDPKCPSTNRPAPDAANPTRHLRFTCGTGAASAVLEASGIMPLAGCNPNLPVPLRVGDYVTYSGILVPDANAPADAPSNFLVAAYGLDAELGVYTVPGTEPVYVLVEEAIEGTKGARFFTDPVFGNIPQEETTRFHIVGFSTDVTRNVEVGVFDSDRDGSPPTHTSMSGAAGLPPNNFLPFGRFRTTTNAKAGARAVRRDAFAYVVGSARGATGPAPDKPLPDTGLDPTLKSGTYEAPIGEFIYPEATDFGNPGFPTPVPTENFC